MYATMNKDFSADPNENYYILESGIIESMNLYLEKRVVKFNKKKHKKDPWMTHDILKSVNCKNKLYKTWKKTKMDSLNYESRKSEFNNSRNMLRRMIKQAKKTISPLSSTNIKIALGKHGKLLIQFSIEIPLRSHPS